MCVTFYYEILISEALRYGMC